MRKLVSRMKCISETMRRVQDRIYKITESTLFVPPPRLCNRGVLEKLAAADVASAVAKADYLIHRLPK